MRQTGVPSTVAVVVTLPKPLSAGVRRVNLPQPSLATAGSVYEPSWTQWVPFATGLGASEARPLPLPGWTGLSRSATNLPTRRGAPVSAARGTLTGTEANAGASLTTRGRDGS